MRYVEYVTDNALLRVQPFCSFMKMRNEMRQNFHHNNLYLTDLPCYLLNSDYDFKSSQG
jgi:hypothetical protein